MRVQGLVVLTATLVMSCASATKRYEQGQELEQQGRPREAAQRYIDALKKDGSLADARQRLSETGNRAIREDVRQADAFENSATYGDAADVLSRIDALVSDASSVSVVLDVPAGYAGTHARVYGRAIDEALSQAAGAKERGNFSESVRLAERAQQRWQPSGAQQASLSRMVYDAQYAWAQSEMSNGRYKSAFAQADAAAGAQGADRSALEALKADAVRRGTIVVAVFPVVARGTTDARILPELNESLVLDQWQRPPQWISIVNSVEVQRMLRQRNLLTRDLEAQDAASLARQLGARVAVALTLDSARYSESKVTRSRHAVKTRAGVDTAYMVDDGQLEAWAKVTWRDIDPNGARVVARGDVNERATGQFRRASYGGNWRDLVLSQDERKLFDQRDARDTQDAIRDVARKLSDRIGRDVAEDLLRRVD